MRLRQAFSLLGLVMRMIQARAALGGGDPGGCSKFRQVALFGDDLRCLLIELL